MEQSSQPINEQTEASITIDSTKPKTSMIVLVIAGVFGFIVVVGGWWFVRGEQIVRTLETMEQTDNDTIQEQTITQETQTSNQLTQTQDGGYVWNETINDTIQEQTITQETQTSNQLTQTQDGGYVWNETIKFNPTPTLIKTTPIRVTGKETFGIDGEGTLQMFNIGTIIAGTFKDKTLTLALAITADGMGGVTPFGSLYFISDSSGKPIAWDMNFVRGDYFIDSCNFNASVNCIALAKDTQQNLGILPKELSRGYADLGESYENKNKALELPFSKIDLFGELTIIDTGSMAVVGTTESGFPIVTDSKTDGQEAVTSMAPQYHIVLPFGRVFEIALEPNFVNTEDVPNVTWSIGTTKVASYRYGRFVYGWQDCYEGISNDAFKMALVQTGVTVYGDAVYELNAEAYPKTYACLHEKTKRYEYNPETETGAYKDTVSYEDFIRSHPMFFWRHQYGELMAFVRSDVVPAAGKGKPVVYLYPEHNERVGVRVNPIGGFTKTDPEYGNGWVVDATPDGFVTNSADGKQYPYLFWEGGEDGVVKTPKEGFVVTKDDVATTLDEKLSAFGLNTRERSDFLEYWVPKLSRAPYYFITFISRSEIDRVAPMTVSPRPETVIRVLMDYKPLTEPVAADPLAIPKIDRNGFTVVEWGGIIRD